MNPVKIDDAFLAFPGSVDHLMPRYVDIPAIYKDWNQLTKWNQLFSDWFYKGLKKIEFKPKEGINQEDALRHIRAIMGSFGPKHEHKEAAVAYLLSQWFEDVTWEAKELKL